MVLSGCFWFTVSAVHFYSKISNILATGDACLLITLRIAYTRHESYDNS